MTATFEPTGPSAQVRGSGRRRAPEGSTTGSMGVVPADRRSREAHAAGRPGARPAGLGSTGPVPAPLSRAARTAGLSLAALGALAGAGGVAAGDLASTDEPASTGEFALPTNLASADMSLAGPSHSVLDVAAPAVMPAVNPVASAKATAAPAIKTSSPAARAAGAQKAAQQAKAAKADAQAREANEAEEASSSAGAKAVALAKSQIGVPYEWGGTTTSGFDCSGLMQWAFDKVGKDLPRTSSAQAQEGEKVSTDNLKPGDLVFMYSPISHVGMYAGNGQIVEAPTEGEDVKMTPLSKYEDKIVSARRL